MGGYFGFVLPLQKLKLYLSCKNCVSEHPFRAKAGRIHSEGKIDELGPKLNDCPALVLPCTTAK